MIVLDFELIEMIAHLPGQMIRNLSGKIRLDVESSPVILVESISQRRIVERPPAAETEELHGVVRTVAGRQIHPDFRQKPS